MDRRSRLMFGRRRLVAMAALLAVVVAATTLSDEIGRTGATFTDAATAGSNTFSTTSCFTADVKGVQSGTATSTANGTLTVAITSVDTSKSFLMFSIRHLSNRPVGSTVRGRVASSTSLEFARVTDESTPVTITIQWYVVEYLCGVRVQRGSVAQSSTTVNVPVTTVGSRSRTFVTFSKTAGSTDTSWDANDAVVAELTSTSNLQLRTNTANSAHTIWWQIVEFTNPADVNVQRGLTSMTGTALSSTVTLPASVDPARTFVLVSFRTSGSGVDIGSRMLRARLTNSNTIVIDRSVSGTPDDITEIAWEAVELNDGSRVQHASEAFGAGDLQRVVSISPVDLGRAAAFASVEYGGGQSGGRTPYVSDDYLCAASFTATLASSTLTLDRACNAMGEDVGWFVVEWGRRSWWDTSYSYRKQTTVSASGATAPSGYSASLTFDHAALVAASKSQADGDDVRVAHWNGTAWTQLDRVLGETSSWNSASTQIWFSTQGSVADGTLDSGYYLYYGDPSALSPPASKANVYLAYDDFTSATVNATPSDWTVQTGGPWHAVDSGGNRILRRKATGGTTGRQYLKRNGISETNVYVQAKVRMTAGGSEDTACAFMRGAGTGSADLSGYRFCIQDWPGEGRVHHRGKMVSGTFTNIERTPYAWSDATWYTTAGAIYGSTLKMWVNGSLVATNTDTSLSAAGSVGLYAFVGSQIDYDFDDVLVRRYVSPEPTSSLGAEELL
jgi:hypothetical protein